MKISTSISTAVCFVLVLLMSTCPAMGSYASVVTADNPMAYWQFENSATAFDSMGNHNGSYQGGVSLVAGRVGQAARFDNVDDPIDDYINFDKSLGAALGNANASAITMEAWINVAKLPSGENNVIFSTLIYSNKSGAILQTDGESISVGGRSVYYDKTTNIDQFQSKIVPYTFIDEWHHIVGILDFAGKTISVYIDGEFAGSGGASFAENSYTYSAPDPGCDDTVGAMKRGTTAPFERYFNGMIDEVAVYKKALTATQIKAHYNALPEPTSLLLLGLSGLAIIARRRNRT